MVMLKKECDFSPRVWCVVFARLFVWSWPIEEDGLNVENIAKSHFNRKLSLGDTQQFQAKGISKTGNKKHHLALPAQRLPKTREDSENCSMLATESKRKREKICIVDCSARDQLKCFIEKLKGCWGRGITTSVKGKDSWCANWLNAQLPLEPCHQSAEYSWECTKNHFWQRPTREKRNKEIFRSTVRLCISRNMLSTERITKFSKRAWQ